MAYFFWPKSEQRSELKRLGLQRYAHVPFILGDDLEYLDEINRFLRERALGVWSLGRGAHSPYATGTRLSENSIIAYARDLENFWTYVEVAKLPWQEITYIELLETYEADLASGRWTVRGKALTASTINRRVDRAVEFLSWAAQKGLREELKNTTKTTSRSFANGTSIKATRHSTQSRSGRKSIVHQHMRLPTQSEIEKWLSEIKSRRGRTMALACETILKTGLRRTELVLLRAAQLPDPELVNLDRPARMEICYGTKGQRNPSDPEFKGKARTLRFDRDFLVKLNNYRQLGRSYALEKYRRRNPGKPAPLQLFLNEKNGDPINADQLYRAWKNAKSLPFPGFSPHKGRHVFACYTLLGFVDKA